MHYLTNYYKNLSEQLQEKVNNLQKLLNEKRDTEEVLVTGYKVTSAPPGGSSEMRIHGVVTRGVEPGRKVVVHRGLVYADQLRGTGRKIGTSETPVITVSAEDLTPDHYDGRDRDLRGDLPELLHGKREEEMRALLPKTQDNQDLIDYIRDKGFLNRSTPRPDDLDS
jgi:hypothetical protein